ncbi:hypothetical protein T5B8_09681 [Salinisphaera sp. T5B8]
MLKLLRAELNAVRIFFPVPVMATFAFSVVRPKFAFFDAIVFITGMPGFVMAVMFAAFCWLSGRFAGS